MQGGFVVYTNMSCGVHTTFWKESKNYYGYLNFHLPDHPLEPAIKVEWLLHSLTNASEKQQKIFTYPILLQFSILKKKYIMSKFLLFTHFEHCVCRLLLEEKYNQFIKHLTCYFNHHLKINYYNLKKCRSLNQTPSWTPLNILTQTIASVHFVLVSYPPSIY